eukprot:4099852-Heterocapsa_arctica.AAC.1
MDPRSWYGQCCQTTYSGNKGNGLISRRSGGNEMTYSHEDSTQKKAEICKTHTYCMGTMRKDKTTYGGNKWKGPILGKTNKQIM